ncbi:DUF1552 domain-containing protein [Anatilimnocola floriformis]|uniref:DUF1552 domain-containing protein n=1 Tax=Anatilimnocola floriformis TaxID=2948575 RepID=UPI0020C475A3|nr:DUF1552 domain-containing protein [Anatilimnocola floriformis]
MPRLSRRTLLRAAGVSISLPLLDAMLPVGLRAETKAEKMSPQRLVLIGRPLGFHAPFFFPEKPGGDYTPSRYTKLIDEHRDHFTVFSGISHRGYPGGHGTHPALFTGVRPEGVRPGDLRNTISLDQLVAARAGNETRFASLALGGGELSWNAKGVKIPAEDRATQVFKALFVQGTPAEVAKEMKKLAAGQSILDGVRDQAKTLSQSLNSADRDRLDLLLSSIREAEARLAQDKAWIDRAKPVVETKPFTDDYITGGRMLTRTQQWFDLIHLALQTDSTRVISFSVWSHEALNDLPGLTMAHHDASHHGQDEAKINELAKIEEAEIKLFGGLLAKLKGTAENDRTLLDRTSIVYASSLGNASAHTVDNLPVILAGGGFQHAGHLGFNRKENYQLSNVYVRLLQQLQFETDKFGNSDGVLSEV